MLWIITRACRETYLVILDGFEAALITVSSLLVVPWAWLPWTHVGVVTTRSRPHPAAFTPPCYHPLYQHPHSHSSINTDTPSFCNYPPSLFSTFSILLYYHSSYVCYLSLFTPVSSCSPFTSSLLVALVTRFSRCLVARGVRISLLMLIITFSAGFNHGSRSGGKIVIIGRNDTTTERRGSQFYKEFIWHWNTKD